MNVEILGGGFRNKGAQLMLCAISRHFAENAPHVRLVAGPRTGSALQKAQYGVHQLMDTGFLGRSGQLFDWLTPKPIRELYGLFHEKDVDAILDASGYRYGDHNSLGCTEGRARRYEKWKKKGKKLILMPQAFGPFDNPKVLRAFRRILGLADLVFARDEVSYEHAIRAGGPADRVKIAPDFTNLVPATPPPDADHLKGSACIVPNMRMLDRTNGHVQDNYLPFLAFCYRHLEGANLHPFVLVHETGDGDLPGLLEAELRRAVRIIREDDAVVLKGILGSSCLVVGSRYHALISALGQGVPCLGTAWSHKYGSLFRDYGCADLVVESLGSQDEVAKKLHSMIEEPSRSDLVQALRHAAERQKDATRKMWGQVEEVLES